MLIIIHVSLKPISRGIINGFLHLVMEFVIFQYFTFLISTRLNDVVVKEMVENQELSVILSAYEIINSCISRQM